MIVISVGDSARGAIDKANTLRNDHADSRFGGISEAPILRSRCLAVRDAAGLTLFLVQGECSGLGGASF